VPKPSEMSEVEVYVQHETAGAWLVTKTRDPAAAEVWLPKRSCELEGEWVRPGQLMTAWVHEAMAIDKELV
jgi:hypothetical protein